MKSSLRITSLLFLAAFFLFPAPTDARTWRVTVDGTGDAPTIEAAMDSAAAFDTVLVAPGEHVIERVFGLRHRGGRPPPDALGSLSQPHWRCKE
jgi:hypothetical protein